MSGDEPSKELARRPDDRPARPRRRCRRLSLNNLRRRSGPSRRALPEPEIPPPDQTPILSYDELRRRALAKQQDLEEEAGKQTLRHREDHHQENMEVRRLERQRQADRNRVEKARLWIGTGRRLVWLVVAVAVAVGLIAAVAAGLRPSDLLSLLRG